MAIKITKLTRHLGGLVLHLENSKKQNLSIALHNGSYGQESDLYEIYPSWRKPSKDDAVKGWLTLDEVNKWVAELIRNDKKVGQ